MLFFLKGGRVARGKRKGTKLLQVEELMKKGSMGRKRHGPLPKAYEPLSVMGNRS